MVVRQFHGVVPRQEDADHLLGVLRSGGVQLLPHPALLPGRLQLRLRPDDVVRPRQPHSLSEDNPGAVLHHRTGVLPVLREHAGVN